MASGLVMGLVLLTRPNLLLVAAAASVLWAGYRWQESASRVAALAFVLAWSSVLAVMAVRNYAVVQQVSLAALTDTRDWLAPNSSGVDRYLVSDLLASPARTLELYARRLLFVMGVLPALEPEFRVRPHWIAAWLGFGAYTLWRLLTRHRPPFWEAVVWTAAVSYVGPLVAAASITNYGFRMLVPGVPLVLALGFRLVDQVVLEAVRPSPRTSECAAVST